MENVPEYKLVFLNELHEDLKRLDPHRTPIAGLYRILGRLTDYDLHRQIAIVESCFHHEYTPETSGDSFRTTKQYPSVNSAQSVSKSEMIDLTQDEEEDVNQDQNQHRDTKAVVADSTYIDLTSSTDEEDSATEPQEYQIETTPFVKDNLSPPNPHAPKPIELTQRSSSSNVRNGGGGGRKITLWIDTHLLGQWRYEPRALFQFIGEVIYEAGHWILQARTCRNMDGLDLYTYRQSILLTRDLMQRDLARRENSNNSSNNNFEHTSVGGSKSGP
ncbi:hypothetical protein BGX21_009184 [Mortierella sp. AD011]|nr:hypothetical protein BGX20_009219 [Mortierella sp. AD010]KAF9397140.1 hypothetical protein BGX21_009184 [Mortierella sp. AD011]